MTKFQKWDFIFRVRIDIGFYSNKVAAMSYLLTKRFFKELFLILVRDVLRICDRSFFDHVTVTWPPIKWCFSDHSPIFHRF